MLVMMHVVSKVSVATEGRESVASFNAMCGNLLCLGLFRSCL